jgi:serine/threonine protein kinase
VHRDISPSNILVGYDGSIKVVDFGIAKASARQETRSSSLKGKISYMSPEQCKGAEVDRRSDVYSLGVVLYELATTTRLFKGESDYLVMDQIVNGRVTLPQVRRPELPNELSAIIMRAIAPDPERRYFTADELRVALDQFAAKASLTTSTSAISTYMRKMFGEKPEPWLDLESQDFDSFEDVAEAPATESAPSKSWTELPQGDEFRRITGSIARQSGAISMIAGSATSETSRSSVSRLTGAPPPTDSKMGWESQQPAAASRGLTPTKVAMICAPVIVLLVIAIWRLAGTGSSTSPVAAATTPPPTQPAPAAAPMVTPIPEPPRVPDVVAVGSDAPESAASARPESSTASRHTASSSSSPSSSSSSRHSSTARDAKDTKIAETAAPAPAIVTKTEAPTLSPAPPIGAAAPPLQSPAVTPAPIATLPVVPPAAPSSLPPPSPAPTPPAPAATPTVAPTVLDANRISGDKEIVPDETTQTEIARSGIDQIGGSFKICLTEDGAINAVTLLKSTGFPSYDVRIQNTIRKSWRYRPIMMNGKPTAVCTAVRFVYHQK